MKIKRFLAMCLAAIMLVSCMAVSASAAEGFSTLYYHSASCSLSGVPDSSGVCAPGVNAKSRVANGYIWDTPMRTTGLMCKEYPSR